MRLKRLIANALGDEGQFGDFAGEFISRFRLAQEPEISQVELTAAELEARLKQGHLLAPNRWARLCWIPPADQGHDNTRHAGTSPVRLFASGSKLTCSRQLAIRLCQATDAPVRIDPGSLPLDTTDLECLSELLKQGHLTLE